MIQKTIIVLILTLCSWWPVMATGEMKQAVFIPHWVPHAEFAGYYTALSKGIYRKYGIDLKIIDGGPDRPTENYLENGKANFACLWLTSGIAMHAAGIPVVHLAQLVKRSALMLVARADSGIRTPGDMNGKKVGVWRGLSGLQPRTFFRKHELKIIEVPQSYSVNLFLRGGVDVVSAMWYNEYHAILNSGINPDELVTFF